MILLGAMMSCKKSNTEDHLVQMRVRNTTAFDMTEVTIDPEGTSSDTPGPKAVVIGSLAAGQTSGYTTYKNLYAYSWISVVMNGKKYYLKPLGYGPDKPLIGTNYTYGINYLAAEDRITLGLYLE